MNRFQEKSDDDFRFSSFSGIDYRESGRGVGRLLRGALWTLIIGFVCLVLAATFMALPADGGRRANEAGARNSLHTILQAQLQYDSTFPNRGYACSLQALGGDPDSGPPSPEAAQILRSDLASGIKNGYFFEIRSCRKETRSGIERVVGYRVVALPIVQGKTGHRGYCADESGNLKYDPNGGDNCTELYK